MPTTQAIVLNGASSSGKSSIAAQLQTMLPRPFLHLGADTMVDALPPGGGIEFDATGAVTVDETFRRLEHSWYEGLAAIARDGAGVIVDEVFLGGAMSQRRLSSALTGVTVVWVGVRCDLDVAVAREATRPDRLPGMAAAQSGVVHVGVEYDLEVDTTVRSARECATAIAAQCSFP